MDHLAETEDHTYKSQMEWANGQMSEGQIKLLQFSLSLRTESPKIQMFQQIALDFGVDKLDCPAVVQNPANNAISCLESVPDLQKFASESNFLFSFGTLLVFFVLLKHYLYASN